MNEQYGVELQLIVNKFNERIQQVQKKISSIKDEKIDVNVDSAQIRYVEQQIKEISALLDYNKRKPFMEQSELLKTEAELEKLTDKYNKLIDANNKVSNTSNKSFSSMNKGFEQMTSKIKRFGFSLLGIHTIWSMVSRASSAYLTQDTELANKMQAVWVGLGSMLAPIIEGIANILIKAVKYINIFVTALTGVNLLARATAKSMDKASKSAKGLHKALGGFDELTNLDDNSGNGAGDLSWVDPFNDIDIDTTWADRIREFGLWVKANFPEVVSIIAGLGTAILAIKLGLGGIKAIGIGTMIAGIVWTIQTLIEYMKDPSWENFGKIIEGIGIAILGLGITIGSLPVAVAGAIVLIVGLIVKNWEKIKSKLNEGVDWIKEQADNIKGYLDSKLEDIRYNFGFVGELIVGAIEFGINFIVSLVELAKEDIINYFGGIFDGAKKILDGIIKIFQGDFQGGISQVGEGIKEIFTAVWGHVFSTFTRVWEAILRAFNGGGEIFNGLKEGVEKVFKTIVNGLIRGLNWAIAQPFNRINGLLNTIKSINVLGAKPFDGMWGWNPISVPQIPQLNVGTNYVPEDQVAMIHKGEAVVPKKFNSKEYFGNNDETNSLLERMIQAIDNIEINPYTTIKEVGQTAVNYINQQKRVVGRSVV